MELELKTSAEKTNERDQFSINKDWIIALLGNLVSVWLISVKKKSNNEFLFWKFMIFFYNFILRASFWQLTHFNFLFYDFKMHF